MSSTSSDIEVGPNHNSPKSKLAPKLRYDFRHLFYYYFIILLFIYKFNFFTNQLNFYLINSL